jgi:hypothetical protein
MAVNQKALAVNQKVHGSNPVWGATPFRVRTHRALVNHAFPRFRPKMATMPRKQSLRRMDPRHPIVESARARRTLSHSLSELARLVNGRCQRGAAKRALSELALATRHLRRVEDRRRLQQTFGESVLTDQLGGSVSNAMMIAVFGEIGGSQRPVSLTLRVGLTFWLTATVAGRESLGRYMELETICPQTGLGIEPSSRFSPAQRVCSPRGAPAPVAGRESLGRYMELETICPQTGLGIEPSSRFSPAQRVCSPRGAPALAVIASEAGNIAGRGQRSRAQSRLPTCERSHFRMLLLIWWFRASRYTISDRMPIGGGRSAKGSGSLNLEAGW